jgi:hypothetical protein
MTFSMLLVGTGRCPVENVERITRRAPWPGVGPELPALRAAAATWRAQLQRALALLRCGRPGRPACRCSLVAKAFARGPGWC